MKKVIYSAMVFGAIALSSCGNEGKENHETNEHHDESAHHEEGEHAEHVEEDIEEEVVSFPVEGYEFYGVAEVKPDEAVTVEEMVAIVEDKGNFEGNVSAVLDGVCKKQGCWVTMKNKNGESVRVRFKDHSFGVPTDTPEGTLVVLRGVATMDTTTVELQKHFLDDAKEAGEEVSQEDYDAITDDIIEVSFISDGILVKK